MNKNIESRNGGAKMEEYEELEMEVIVFACEDVITTSGEDKYSIYLTDQTI